MSRTLWITGAAGFTGRHMLEYASGLGQRPRIVALDIASSMSDCADVFFSVDITDAEAVAQVARREPPTWVMHLAGAMPPATESEMMHSNVKGTAGLLAGLVVGGCRGTRVVSVGSAAEYLQLHPGPVDESAPVGGASAYGRIKWIQSLAALGANKGTGLVTMVVRPFNLLGPGLPSRLVAGRICEQFAVEGELAEITVRNTTSARDFIDVRDAVKAYWLLAERGLAGEVYNVCSGVARTVQDLLDICSEISGKSPRIVIEPEETPSNAPPVVCGDYSRLHAATGWRPSIELRKSLADMLNAATQSVGRNAPDRSGSQHN